MQKGVASEVLFIGVFDYDCDGWFEFNDKDEIIVFDEIHSFISFLMSFLSYFVDYVIMVILVVGINISIFFNDVLEVDVALEALTAGEQGAHDQLVNVMPVDHIHSFTIDVLEDHEDLFQH